MKYTVHVVTKTFISNVGQSSLARSAMLAMLYCCLFTEWACSCSSGVGALVVSVVQLLAQMAAISVYYV